MLSDTKIIYITKEMSMANSNSEKNVSLLEDNDWLNFLKLIRKGKCTPFIGAGACAGVLPLAREIANNWATTYNYPLKDSDDLPRVAQFVAIEQYDMLPKEEIIDQFEGCTSSQLF